MKHISVFCGASCGNAPEYVAAAQQLGKLLAQSNIGLVYGGAKVGLMGTIADSVLNAGGYVTGVIPEHIVKHEIAHHGVSDLRIVNSMHERKAMMAEMSDGFIAMPGGLGTLEEVCEILTWIQLGLHAKPVGFLNVNHFYGKLFSFLDHAVAEQFLKPEFRNNIYSSESPAELLRMFSGHQKSVMSRYGVV